MPRRLYGSRWPAISPRMAVLLWFKRDLRVTDQPALAAAATSGPVLPVYVVEPGYWALPDTSARQWAFTAECLQSLRAECPLIVRVGDAVEVLARLAAVHGIREIVSHEETGNGWTYARDRAAAAWARQVGIAWTELPQSGVVRRLKSRDGWAQARERWIRQPRVDVPPVNWLKDMPGRIPNADELGLTPDVCPGRQLGGRAEALKLLGGFLTERGRTYRKAMSSPLEGEWTCSRLSPYLALGVLSGREAAQAAAAREAEVTERDGWKGSLTSFTSRLAWRDHFMQ
ncbi:MAG: deoxyribodipyrimidine photo-lyase, partial [Pseudomonadota bacterium]